VSRNEQSQHRAMSRVAVAAVRINTKSDRQIFIAQCALAGNFRYKALLWRDTLVSRYQAQTRQLLSPQIKVDIERFDGMLPCHRTM
jgi:hypothetical protein